MKTISNRDALTLYLATLADQNPQYAYGIMTGRKYVRVYKRLGLQDSLSVVCFVDLATGLVYRADSWTKRGRILTTLAKAVA
jgi:hypothetical protein